MRREHWLVVALLFPATAAAQHSVLLRFRPPPGSRVQTLSELQVTAVVDRFPSVPDSTVVDASLRTVVTQRVLEGAGTSRLLSVTLDSIRARAKVGDAVRGEIAPPVAQGFSARYRLSERLERSDASSAASGDSGEVVLLAGRFGGFECLLPESQIPVSGHWSSSLRFPLGAYLGATGKVTSSGAAWGSSTLTLDSLVPRGADTLAYFGLTGVLDPTTVPVTAEGGKGSGQFTGEFAASIIWSTGWHAVVSAVSNGVVQGRIRIERPEGVVNGVLSLTISGRHRVRL